MLTCIIRLLMYVERQVNRWRAWVRWGRLVLDLQMAERRMEQERTQFEHCLLGM